jgi:hypothetical protein
VVWLAVSAGALSLAGERARLAAARKTECAPPQEARRKPGHWTLWATRHPRTLRVASDGWDYRSGRGWEALLIALRTRALLRRVPSGLFPSR